VENWVFWRASSANQITSCASVLVARCVLNGPSTGFFGGTSATLPGLLVRSSQVCLYDSSSTGGTGSTGIDCNSGVLFLAGCTVRGGQGTLGLSGSTCSNGGPGGIGLSLPAPARAFLLDTSISGGPGGWPGRTLTGWCSFGPPGSAVAGSGTLTSLPGAARSFESVAPLLERETVPLTFAGEEGDLAALLLSAGQQHALWPELFGVRAVALPALAPLIGAVPMSGTLGWSFVLSPGIVAPGEAAVVFTQGFFQDSGGLQRLGSPFGWVLLDENHDPNDGCPPP
jgi:hypothetical protein